MAGFSPEQLAQIRQLIAEELRAIADQLEGRSVQRFLAPREAIARMGLSITPKQMAAHVRSGWLRSGKEFIDVGTGGSRPTYRYDPVACRDRLSVPPERRSLRVV